MESGSIQSGHRVRVQTITTENASTPPTTYHFSLTLSEGEFNELYEFDINPDSDIMCYVRHQKPSVLHPCVFAQNKIAMRDVNTHELKELNGEYALTLNVYDGDMNIEIAGIWEAGRPKGGIWIGRTVNDETSFYAGKLTLSDGMCEFSGKAMRLKVLSSHIDIDTSLAGSKANVKAQPTVDYTSVLKQDLEIQYFYGRTIDGKYVKLNALFVGNKLAYLHVDNETFTLLNGYCLLSASNSDATESVVMGGKYKNGVPDGMFFLSVMNAHVIHNYLGTLVIAGTKCNFSCTEQLTDGAFHITDKGVIRVAQTSHGKTKDLFTGKNAKIKLGNAIIEGSWKKGSPNGTMKHTVTTDEKMTIFEGPLELVQEEVQVSNGTYIEHAFKGHGNAQETVRFSSGEINIYRGTWIKGELTGEAAYITIKPNTSEPCTKKTGEIMTYKIVDAKRFIDVDDKVQPDAQASSAQEQDEDLIVLNHYKGEFENNLPHGYGTTTRLDDFTYEGDHVEGKFHGTGSIVWTNGPKKDCSYEGEFENNKRTGMGVFIRKDGTEIHGLWKEGVLIRRDSFGFSFQGTFNDQFERQDGRCTLTWPDGTSFEGFWKAGQCAGKEVTLILADKRKYLGPFVMGDAGRPVPHGDGITWDCVNNAWPRSTRQNTKWDRGELRKAERAAGTPSANTPKKEGTRQLAVSQPPTNNNSTPRPSTVPTASVTPKAQTKTEPVPTQPTFEPQPKSSSAPPPNHYIFDYLGLGNYFGLTKGKTAHGKGTLTDKNGVTYKGNWNMGKPEGEFTIIYSKLSRYVGEVRKFEFAQSSRKKNVTYTYTIERHGKGKLSWTEVASKGKATLKSCKATWDEGKITGQVQLKYKNGSRYIGSIDDQYQPHGAGSMTRADGTNVTEQWEHGVVKSSTVINPKPDNKHIDENESLPSTAPPSLIDTENKEDELQASNQEPLPPLSQEPEPLPSLPARELDDSKSNESPHEATPPSTPTAAPLKAVRNNTDLRVPTQDFLSIRLDNGDQYVGFGSHGKPNGKGKLTDTKGWSFEGNFKDGKFDPIGGTISKGDMTCTPLGDNNTSDEIRKLNFYGEIHWTNGSHYKGWVKDGLRHKYGEYHDVDGKNYQGNFIDGNPSGQGTLALENGDIYESRNFTPESYSTLTFDKARMYFNKIYSFEGPIDAGKPGDGEGTFSITGNGAELYKKHVNNTDTHQ